MANFVCSVLADRIICAADMAISLVNKLAVSVAGSGVHGRFCPAHRVNNAACPTAWLEADNRLSQAAAEVV